MGIDALIVIQELVGFPQYLRCWPRNLTTSRQKLEEGVTDAGLKLLTRSDPRFLSLSETVSQTGERLIDITCQKEQDQQMKPREVFIVYRVH